MQAKKRLIAKLAAGAVLVLALAGGAGLAALRADHAEHRRFTERQEAEKQQRVEGSRAYLAELAQRIDALPVDATLVSEVESRYFEEQADGPFYLWAMDTQGAFAFGVPQSSFAKLNAIYDREVTPRLKEGVFLDRQTFLLGLVDDVDDIAREALPEDKAAELVERGQRFRLDRWEPEQSFVISTPLKAKDGAALGSLYLKRTPAPERSHYRTAAALEVVMGVAGALVGFSALFLWVLLPTWVFVDARERGVRRAPLFAFLTVISSLVGLVVYLIARPENPPRLTCPGCAKEVNGGAFCPHCGRDLSASFCPACRYPLKPDWAFCPACRTELKAAPGGAPVTQAG